MYNIHNFTMLFTLRIWHWETFLSLWCETLIMAINLYDMYKTTYVQH